MSRQGNRAAAHDPVSSSEDCRFVQTSVWRGLYERLTQSSRSLRLGVRLGSSQEPKHDAEKKKTTE